MADFVQYDLGQVQKGSTVVVNLGSQANVMLVDQSGYNNYRNGRRFSYHGGRMTKSPARIGVPSSGRWYVVIDLGGYGGTIRSSVSVQPPPRGFLPEYREPSPIDAIRHTRVDEPLAAGVDPAGVRDVFISHASEDKADVARRREHMAGRS